MRVRILTLRLIAALLTGLWAAAAVLVLTGYRPGGPGDLAVGLSALLPAVVAAAGIIWPPGARGGSSGRANEDPRIAVATAWLGLVSALLLVPSVAGLAGNLAGGAGRPLIPSAEAAYAFLLPLAGTCLFTGIGIARALLRERFRPRPGFIFAGAIAAVMTLAGAVAFAGATLANEAAVRERTGGSRWGPTDPSLAPPRCSGALATGASAAVDLIATARVDATRVGAISLSGVRNADAERWQASVSGQPTSGSFEYVRVPPNAWLRDDGQPWQPVSATPAPATLDTAVVENALTPQARASAEEVGVEETGGAPARHCRIAVDGPLGLRAFPTLRWLVGGNPFQADPQLDVWRGELDWWVFADGQLGMATLSLHGPTFGVDWPVQGFQATLEARLTALDRGQPQVVEPPAR
jgi:hypothetical protein